MGPTVRPTPNFIVMSVSLLETDRVGLCFTCQQARQVRTDRGSVFYQCQRSSVDPQYPKYPRLPVLHCPGYEAKADQAEPPN
jgi:hypothetical protein